MERPERSERLVTTVGAFCEFIRFWSFEFWSLYIVSYFVLRISDLSFQWVNEVSVANTNKNIGLSAGAP